MIEHLRSLILNVPDYPEPGIQFKDITPLLADADALAFAAAEMIRPFLPRKPDVVCAIESRGFILGAAIAARHGVGFVPARKPGKLPRPTFSEAYSLEYGKDGLHVHQDAFRPGARVLLVDDVLATGGTAAAALKLVKAAGGVPVGCAFLLEIGALGGRAKLDGVPVHTVLPY